jgi:hypothetical protein
MSAPKTAAHSRFVEAPGSGVGIVMRRFFVGVADDGQPYITYSATLANAAAVVSDGVLGVDPDSTGGLNLAALPSNSIAYP